MNNSSPCFEGPDSGFYSATFISESTDKNSTESTSENSKLQSQLEYLKKSLKLRIKDLRIQQELTRDLEDELDRTKMDLACLQDKCERQERRCKSMTVRLNFSSLFSFFFF